MVLGRITVRRKKTKDTDDRSVRSSPSLPNIPATGLSQSGWPESLVNIHSIKEAETQYYPPPFNASYNGPGSPGPLGPVERSRGASLQGQASPLAPSAMSPKVGGSPSKNSIPSYHRPFRPLNGPGYAGSDADVPPGRDSIASLYSSTGPVALGRAAYGSHLMSPVQKRRPARAPPTFNLMVVGGQGTGKTSFLKLLLDTCDVSPTCSPEQLQALEQFKSDTASKGNTVKRTKELKPVTIEICEERHERLVLTAIDTPGLDFEEGKELELERGVSDIIKYMDTQFADTMDEESKVVRQNKGDRHVHLCIYLVDPSTITSPLARHASKPIPTRYSSEHPLPQHIALSLNGPVTAEPDTYIGEDGDDYVVISSNGEVADNARGKAPPLPKRTKSSKAKKSQEQAPLSDEECISPAELKVIKRLSKKSNVLPIIAKADTLTEARLVAVKEAIRRDFAELGIGFGVFGMPAETRPTSAPSTTSQEEQKESERATSPQNGINGEGEGDIAPNGTTDLADEDHDQQPEDEERSSRPVVKLKSSRHKVLERSRSRTRLRHEIDDDDEAFSSPGAPGDGDETIVAWGGAPRRKVLEMLPFAIFSPEPRAPPAKIPAPRPRKASRASEKGSIVHSAGSPSVNGGTPKSQPPPLPPMNPLRRAEANAGSVGGQTPAMNHSELPPTDPSSIPPPPPIVPANPETSVTKPWKRRPSFKATMAIIRGPAEMKGMFVRRYRWGTLDALDSGHCDYVALRAAVLGTHLKALKKNTNEVLYEKYRTEKLLVRRATRTITDAERKKLLHELGI